MKCIDEMIQKMQDQASRYDDDYMIAQLELADKLCEISKNADTSFYVDKIAKTFCEILETQQEIVEDLKGEINSLHREMERRTIAPVGAQSSYLPLSQVSVVKEKEEPKNLLEVPDGGEFKDSLQVKEAFFNFLNGIKNSKGKGLSPTTMYDYSSRINMLWLYFEKEWKSGELEGKFQICDKDFRPGETYLNVYNNLSLLRTFLEYKSSEIKAREAKGRPFSAEELAQSPLNFYKNVNNSSAALAKFEAFKKLVDELVQPHGAV